MSLVSHSLALYLPHCSTLPPVLALACCAAVPPPFQSRGELNHLCSHQGLLLGVGAVLHQGAGIVRRGSCRVADRATVPHQHLVCLAQSTKQIRCLAHSNHSSFTPSRLAKPDRYHLSRPYATALLPVAFWQGRHQAPHDSSSEGAPSPWPLQRGLWQVGGGGSAAQQAQEQLAGGEGGEVWRVSGKRVRHSF